MNFFRSHPVSSLIALALILRLALLLFAGINAPLAGDELQYQQIAANVAAGHGFVQNNNPFFPSQVLYAWQAPLYPLSLAALYFVFGPHILIAKLFGILVGTATVGVMYDLARRTFSNSRVAFLAALFVAIYPGFLTNAHLLLSETLFIFLILLAFDLFIAAYHNDTRGIWLLAAAGACWGAATLTRGIALYFVVPLLFWFLIHTSAWKKRILGGAIFLLSFSIILAPWAARNYTIFHQFVLLETKGGINFWLGNSPYTPNDFIRNVWKVGVREPMLAVLPNDEIVRDRAAYTLGIDYVQRAPRDFIARMPIKFADFWGFERNLVDVAEATRTGKSGGWNSLAKGSADLISAAVYVLLTLLAIGGFVFVPNDKWKVLFGGFVIYFVLVHIVVFGDGRFHFPLIPLIALYAAWFIAQRAQISPARVISALALVTIFATVWLHEIAAAWRVLNT